MKKQQLYAKQVLLLGLALIAFFILLSSVVELYKKRRTIKQHISALEQETGVLSEKYTRTQTLNKSIETPEGQEYILRDKYRMVRKGEGLIVVTEPLEDLPEPQKPALRRFWESIKRGLGR